MIKVLIIGYVWPEPNSSAAGSRMMQLIDLFMAQGWQVSYASPAATSSFMFDIESIGIQRIPIELNSSSFDDFISSFQPDIVMYDRFMMEEQFGWRVDTHCPAALTILETVDLHCLRDARHLALKQQRELVKRDFFSDVAKREVASIHRCDLTLMISTIEIDILEKYFNVDLVLLHHVPFMLPTISEETVKEWPKFSERQHFITIGNFKHEPNWDAVQILKKTIWPIIRKSLPDVECHIYGAYASEKVNQLNNKKDGFLIKGRAENANCVVKQARICLAPLRFGAGIKGKLVEAMINGTPSITTDIGAESMCADYPWNGAIENDPVEFAKKAINIYGNKELWLQSQKNGIKIINAVYNKQDVGEKLIARIKMISDNLDTHRLNNFTGAMLKHHSMRSTEFMSRWIEEKNK